MTFVTPHSTYTIQMDPKDRLSLPHPVVRPHANLLYFACLLDPLGMLCFFTLLVYFVVLRLGTNRGPTVRMQQHVQGVRRYSTEGIAGVMLY